MSINEQEYNKIIAKNLKRIMYESGKTQADVSRDLKINKSTLSCWMSGIRSPRMRSLDRLCHYFNIRRSDLLEERSLDNHDSLTSKEAQLLAAFRSLNQEGQDLVLKQAEALSASGLYNIFDQSGVDKKEA